MGNDPSDSELRALRPLQTIHVYSILQCLPNYQSHPTLLPAKGLNLRQAKSIVKMVHLLFAMIDMKPDFVTSTFDMSVLGTRLSLWCQLPGLIPINSLWNPHPALATFYWLHSLPELLQISTAGLKCSGFISPRASTMPTTVKAL
jgi:hypothetical protein